MDTDNLKEGDEAHHEVEVEHEELCFEGVANEEEEKYGMIKSEPLSSFSFKLKKPSLIQHDENSKAPKTSKKSVKFKEEISLRKNPNKPIPKYLLKLSSQKLKRDINLIPQFVKNSLEEVKIRENLIKSTTEQLIEELKKPVFRQTTKLRKVTSNLDKDRDHNKICYLIKMIPGFMKFVKFHQIDEDSIRFASKYFEYQKYSAGSLIYEQESESTHFYGIITGTVKIYKTQKKPVFVKNENPTVTRNTFKRQSTKVLSGGKLDLGKKDNEDGKWEMKNVTEEFGYKSKGNCFGYDGLIAKKPRTSTVYAFEDTEMFTLNEASFDKSFSRCIYKSELERKEFLGNQVPTFREERAKFDPMFKNIRPKFLSKGDVIHSEGKSATSFFLVYMGECLLEKKLKYYESSKKNKFKLIKTKLLTLAKGDFSGLEAIEDEATKYGTTLTATNEYTVVLEINLDKILILKSQVKKCLQKLYEKKREIINRIIDEKMHLGKTYTVKYHRDIINEKIHLDQEKMQDQLEEEIKEMQSTKIVPHNDIKNIKYEFNEEWKKAKEKTRLRKKLIRNFFKMKDAKSKPTFIANCIDTALSKSFIDCNVTSKIEKDKERDFGVKTTSNNIPTLNALEGLRIGGGDFFISSTNIIKERKLDTAATIKLQKRAPVNIPLINLPTTRNTSNKNSDVNVCSTNRERLSTYYQSFMNNTDISSPIKRTLNMFNLDSNSSRDIIHYKTGKFNIPLITSFSSSGIK